MALVTVSSKVLSDPLFHPIQFWKTIGAIDLMIKHDDSVDPNSLIYPPFLEELEFVYKNNNKNIRNKIFLPLVSNLRIDTNYPINLFELPRYLETLTLDLDSNQSLSGISFPETLRSLYLFGDFDQNLENISFPKSLTCLYLGYKFNKSLDEVKFPKSLTRLNFGASFDKSINNVKFPDSLVYLNLGTSFNKSINKVKFPDSLVYLNLGELFNKDLGKVKFPLSLEVLIINKFFKKDIKYENIPNLKKLLFGSDLEQGKEFWELEKYIRSLKKKTKFSINWYTSSSYLLFNTILRNNLSLTKKQQKHFDIITQAFKDAPELKEAVTVYRGILSSEFVYSDKTFTSTSLSKKIANIFTGKTCCLLEITATPGSKILPIYYISSLIGESEVLLDRNANLTVTGVDIEDDLQIIKCVYTPKISVETNNESDSGKTEENILPTEEEAIKIIEGVLENSKVTILN